jgi:hypothetical protein
MTMCTSANCQHTKFDPNATKSLSTEDQASLWADIKDARKAMTERVEFLTGIGGSLTEDPKMIKLEKLTGDLWARFRKL